MSSAASNTSCALILAGNRPGGDPFAQEQGVAHKGLIEVVGSAILSRVCEALRGAGIARIVVATNCPEISALAAAEGAEVMPAESGPSASVGAALARYGAPMVVTTADHALLQAGWVADFLQDTPEDADVSILLARREVVERAVPQTKRTWIRLADGQWSGCNLFFLKTARASRAIALWSEVEANRKRPLRMASRLGWGTLLRFVLGRLTLQAMVSRLAGRVGIDARVVAARDGRAAIDVDKAADFALVRELLAKRET
ncbi:nucleotidyltransferase family protein [Croceicoccus bisphenolivorans]|uniref:nucleotidyltransferase family protein n=1 Tax=Croceicoccus bisphenolivorans TaxID=1783232 RepID=UPI00082F5AB3|nr:nucleotidyltransferase family protein [Croceicoccus bisphenolivorans]